jgi:nucleotide-binding universal stress UspA family protein
MFASIVVGTDGSDTASTAVRQAISLAHSVRARLHIVSAYEPVSQPQLRNERPEGPDDVQWTVNPREDVLALLESAEQQARGAGIEHVQSFARQGDAADAILDVAEEQGSDLIVVGNKGMTGASRFLLGSVPNKVSHHAPCSVLIVRTT